MKGMRRVLPTIEETNENSELFSMKFPDDTKYKSKSRLNGENKVYAGLDNIKPFQSYENKENIINNLSGFNSTSKVLNRIPKNITVERPSSKTFEKQRKENLLNLYVTPKSDLFNRSNQSTQFYNFSGGDHRNNLRNDQDSLSITEFHPSLINFIINKFVLFGNIKNVRYSVSRNELVIRFNDQASALLAMRNQNLNVSERFNVELDEWSRKRDDDWLYLNTSQMDVDNIVNIPSPKSVNAGSLNVLFSNFRFWLLMLILYFIL